MEIETPPQSSYEPFRIKEKIGDMIKYGRPLTMQYGRRNRDLADNTRDAMLKMYHLAVEVEKKYYRKTTLQELDVELDWLRYLVRISSDKDYFGCGFSPPLSMHQYEVWSRHIDEIGRMVGRYIAKTK